MGIIGQNNKIYIWKKIIKKTRIIITRCKYFAQINYYKHCSATAHLPPSSFASLQSWGHVGNVFWITLECIFSSRFVHNFFCAPGKKKGFFIFGKDYRDQNEASPFFVLFVLFEVIVQLCWHASLVQELILLSIRLLGQSTYIFYKEKRCVFDERYLIFFSIRKEPFHFFPISVCWALILQLFKRCPGNNYCRHVAGILMIIGKPTALVGAEQPVCQAKKYCKQFSELKTIFWRNFKQFSRT